MHAWAPATGHLHRGKFKAWLTSITTFRFTLKEPKSLPLQTHFTGEARKRKRKRKEREESESKWRDWTLPLEKIPAAPMKTCITHGHWGQRHYISPDFGPRLGWLARWLNCGLIEMFKCFKPANKLQLMITSSSCPGGAAWPDHLCQVIAAYALRLIFGRVQRVRRLLCDRWLILDLEGPRH